MDDIIFTIKLNALNQSFSRKAKPIDVEFSQGYWTYDEEGKQPLKEAKLGDTVYFHFKIKGIAAEKEIDLQLFDYDVFRVPHAFFLDVNPDDDKFPEEEIHKTATVKGGKATVELLLQEKWALVIDDDHKFASRDQKIELYWKVKFGNYKKDLPDKKEDFLRVGYNDRDLFIKTPKEGYNLPELYSGDGSPMLIMEFAKAEIISELKSKGISLIEQQADAVITNIALTKLEKGILVGSTGKEYTTSRITTKDIYKNDGTVLKGVNQGENFGNKVMTTKGISQFDYQATNGLRVKVLGLLKQLGTAVDIFNYFQFVKDGGPDTSEALQLNLGPLTPLMDLAGVLVADMKSDMQDQLSDLQRKKFDATKLQGWDAVRKYINATKQVPEYDDNSLTWMDVSPVTANKLLQGEFKTFEELVDCNDFEDINKAEDGESDDMELPKSVHIVYRKFKDKNRVGFYNYVIETLIVDEEIF